jgi:hypothetical protein
VESSETEEEAVIEGHGGHEGQGVEASVDAERKEDKRGMPVMDCPIIPTTNKRESQ